MEDRLAAWIAPRSDLESAREEVEPFLAMSPEERLAEAAELSRMALAFLDRLPADERDRILWTQEPMDPEAARSWEALVARGSRR